MLQTKLHAHQKNISTHMILHGAEFLPWCLPAAGPRHLGEAASPQGQQGRCDRCGCGWWVGTSRIEPRQKSAWNLCFTLQEHLSSRKLSTSMGDFLCQLRSPGRSTYICLHHVCACSCHVLPILNDVKGSPSMAKVPTPHMPWFVE